MAGSDDPKSNQTTTLPEDVADGVRRLVADAERRGWTVHVRFATRLRYWCPCGGHETWIELYPKAEGYEVATRQRLAHNSCWEVDQ